MPIRRAKTSILKSGDIALIGMPFDDHSSFLKGPAKAPSLIIEAIENDSANYFTEDFIDLADHPDVCWLGNAPLKDYFDIETKYYKKAIKSQRKPSLFILRKL